MDKLDINIIKNRQEAKAKALEEKFRKLREEKIMLAIKKRNEERKQYLINEDKKVVV